ncbi:MAG TPA: type II secretion system protein GspM [Azospirillum sp.]|nr:type II secretion system protein GspM [Azospirillum sp.]
MRRPDLSTTLTPGTPASRLAALLVLAAGLAVAAGALVLPTLTLLDTLSAERQRAEARLEASRRLLERRPALQQALETRGSAPSPDFLRGDTPALAGAALQALVGELARAHGVRLDSTQVLDDRDEDGFRRIAVGVRLGADVAALRTLFHAIETGRPRLLLDAVTVRAAGSGAAPLEVRFTVYGYQEEME